MGILPLYPRVLLILACICATLPITSAYVISLQLLIWLLVTGRWRGTRTGHAGKILKPIDAGVAVLLAALAVSALGAYLIGPVALPWQAPVRVMVHQCIKLGLLWGVLSTTLVAVTRAGWRTQDMLPWWVLWLAVLFVYCVAQRATGINWVHGFDAVLGPHRHAYGVYRISGFMGHPLTLGYNLVMICLVAAVFLARPAVARLDRFFWLVAFGFAGVTLLISGSRFPLLVLVALLVVFQLRHLWRWRWWALGGAVLLAVGLWLEGSLVGRFGEAFDPNASWAQKFPRLMFWKAHLAVYADHPWFGVGIAAIDEVLPVYYQRIGYTEQMYSAHNMFVQMLADSGLIGFAGFCGLLSGLIIAARRAAVVLPGAGLGSLVTAAIVIGLMQNNFRDSEYLFNFWLFVSLVAATAAANAYAAPKAA
jgi:O-antigen ligase